MKIKEAKPLGRPPLPTGEKGVMPTCRIKRSLWEGLKAKSKKDNVSTREILEKIIEKELG